MSLLRTGGILIGGSIALNGLSQAPYVDRAVKPITGSYNQLISSGTNLLDVGTKAVGQALTGVASAISQPVLLIALGIGGLMILKR